MNRSIFAVSIIGSFIAGCSASPSSTNVAVLDGTWNLTTSGIADPSESDDVLAGYNNSDTSAFQLTLKGGAGTEQVTLMVGESACVAQHAFTVALNADGTGSVTESAPGTLVSGGANCDASTAKNYSLFKSGTTSLRRVSVNGSRLVLMSSGSGSSAGSSFFAVFSKA